MLKLFKPLLAVCLVVSCCFLVFIVVSCVLTVTGIEDIVCSESSSGADCCILCADSNRDWGHCVVRIKPWCSLLFPVC